MVESAPAIALEPSLFRAFCRIARDQGGIAIREGKEALVAARVAKRQRALGIPTPRAYLRYLEADDSGAELIHFLDVISTNFTGFLREPEHFEILASHLKGLVASGQRRIRLWSAACASGEEPYSMAITALEAIGEWNTDLKILATDLSTIALGRARQARYSVERVAPLNRFLRVKYFTSHGKRGSGQEIYEVDPAVRRQIAFKRLNLSTPPFPMRGPLDVVFCRNVMIYFDPKTRQRLVDAIERLLAPGGLLMVGHAETLAGVAHGLQLRQASVFAKPVTAARGSSS